MNRLSRAMRTGLTLGCMIFLALDIASAIFGVIQAQPADVQLRWSIERAANLVALAVLVR